MVIGFIITLKPSLKPKLVHFNQKYHGGLGNKGPSHLIQQKILFFHKNKVKRKTTWEQNLSSKMDMGPNL